MNISPESLITRVMVPWRSALKVTWSEPGTSGAALVDGSLKTFRVFDILIFGDFQI